MTMTICKTASKLPPVIRQAPASTAPHRPATYSTSSAATSQDWATSNTATSYLSRACDSCQRLNGPDHPDTEFPHNNMAIAYMSAGDLDRALRLYKASLADYERVLSPAHPTTWTIRANLHRARST